MPAAVHSGLSVIQPPEPAIPFVPLELPTFYPTFLAATPVPALSLQFDLLLAQPSICPSTEDTPSASALAWLTQQPEYLLRYTTMVEIMAPTMRMVSWLLVILIRLVMPCRWWSTVTSGVQALRTLPELAELCQCLQPFQTCSRYLLALSKPPSALSTGRACCCRTCSTMCSAIC